jgi:hypothetical protein
VHVSHSGAESWQRSTRAKAFPVLGQQGQHSRDSRWAALLPWITPVLKAEKIKGSKRPCHPESWHSSAYATAHRQGWESLLLSWTELGKGRDSVNSCTSCHSSGRMCSRSKANIFCTLRKMAVLSCTSSAYILVSQ